MKDFKEIYEQEMDRMESVMMKFPWENPQAYAFWLAQTYYFADITTRLLILAGAHLDSDMKKLHHRFIDHAKEERGHEVLLTMDLKTLGWAINDIPELPSTAGFYQSQFYWIQHKSPLSFFGYIVMLEGLGARCGGPLYQRVIKVHGEKAGHFLKVHGEDDIDHIEKALNEIKTFDVSKQKLVMENFNVSAGLYEMILNDISRRVTETHKEKRAV